MPSPSLRRPRRLLLLLAAAALALCASVGVAAAADDVTVTAQAGGDVDALMDKGKDQYRAKDYAGAVDTFRAVLAVDASVVNAHRGLGRSLEKLDRYEEAQAAYEAMRTAVPDEPEALYRLGIVYRKLGQLDQSIASYEAYAEAMPDDPDPWFGLGETYREKGMDAAAIRAYQRYAELETRPDEQKYVERARERIAELEAALAEAEPPAAAAGETPPPTKTAEAPTVTLPDKVVHTPDPVAPTMPEGPTRAVDVQNATAAEDAGEAMHTADIAFEAGNYTQAADRYLAAHLAAPDALEPAYKLGVALAVAGDVGAAIDAWEAALDVDPGFEPARRNIERARRRLAVEAVVDVDALQGEAAERRGLTEHYLAEGRYQMALRAADALLQLAPADPVAHRLAALAHLGLADASSALTALETELALEPSDAAIYRHMAEAHEILGRDDEAVYFYQLFLTTTDIHDDDDEIRARIRQLGGDPAGVSTVPDFDAPPPSALDAILDTSADEAPPAAGSLSRPLSSEPTRP